jgi:hypothetical protein
MPRGSYALFIAIHEIACYPDLSNQVETIGFRVEWVGSPDHFGYHVDIDQRCYVIIFASSIAVSILLQKPACCICETIGSERHIATMS